VKFDVQVVSSRFSVLSKNRSSDTRTRREPKVCPANLFAG
jgi:hypothetical protein